MNRLCSYIQYRWSVYSSSITSNQTILSIELLLYVPTV